MDDCLADIPGHVVWHDVDAELVLFNSLDATYHTLDLTASEAWRAIARLRRVDAVMDELGSRYPVDRETVVGDVRAFVGDAVRLGLLTLRPEDPS